MFMAGAVALSRSPSHRDSPRSCRSRPSREADDLNVPNACGLVEHLDHWRHAVGGVPPAAWLVVFAIHSDHDVRTSGAAVVDMALLGTARCAELAGTPSSRQARMSQARSGKRVSGLTLFWLASTSNRTRRTVSPSPDASAVSPSPIRLSNFNGSIAR
jgi:hypothetical protein